MNEVECVAVDELPGKTISHFHFGGGGGSIGLRFTDGTVIQFDCRVSGGLGFMEREPFLYPEDFSIAALEEMFGQKMASYIDGRKKQLQDAMDRWCNANEDQAREQYERLKARFEPKPNGPTNAELASQSRLCEPLRAASIGYMIGKQVKTMEDERWKLLMESASEPLTEEELKAGWHWCQCWDDLLVGPGMEMELEHCHCFARQASAI